MDRLPDDLLMYLLDHTTFHDALRLTKTCKRLHHVGHSSRMTRRTRLARKYTIVDIAKTTTTIDHGDPQHELELGSPNVIRIFDRISRTPCARQYINKIIFREPDIDSPTSHERWTKSAQALSIAISRIGLPLQLGTFVLKYPDLCLEIAYNLLLTTSKPDCLEIQGYTIAKWLTQAAIAFAGDAITSLTGPHWLASFRTLTFWGSKEDNDPVVQDRFLRWVFQLPNLETFTCYSLDTTISRYHLPRSLEWRMPLRKLKVTGSDIELSFFEALLIQALGFKTLQWDQFSSEEEGMACRWPLRKFNDVDILLADHGFDLIERSEERNGFVFSI